jgi:ABC-type branched-subunit amino acid transport system substrate-binding protein
VVVNSHQQTLLQREDMAISHEEEATEIVEASPVEAGAAVEVAGAPATATSSPASSASYAKKKVTLSSSASSVLTQTSPGHHRKVCRLRPQTHMELTPIGTWIRGLQIM